MNLVGEFLVTEIRLILGRGWVYRDLSSDIDFVVIIMFLLLRYVYFRYMC